MNLSDLRSAVRRRANVPVTDGVWTDEFVDDAINEALAQISLQQPWPWLAALDTLPGDGEPVDLGEFDPPVRDITSVFVDDYEARPVSIADIDLYPSVQAPGFVFAVWGDVLTIKPDPTDVRTIKVRYFRNEPVLTGGTDTPIMPGVYHYAIIQRACAIGFESLDDTSAAELHDRRAVAMLKSMQDNALRQRRGPHAIRTRSDSMI